VEYTQDYLSLSTLIDIMATAPIFVKDTFIDEA